MIPSSILKPYAPPLLDDNIIDFYNKYDYGDNIELSDAEKLLGENDAQKEIKNFASIIIKKNKRNTVSYRLGILIGKIKGTKKSVKYETTHFEKNQHEYIGRVNIFSIRSLEEKHSRQYIDIINAQFKRMFNQDAHRITQKKIRWNLPKVIATPMDIPNSETNDHAALSTNAQDTSPLPKLPDNLNNLTTAELHRRYIAVATTYNFESNYRFPINMKIVEIYDAAVKQCIAEFNKREIAFINFFD